MPTVTQEGRQEKDHALKWLASNHFMYLPAIWGRHEWTGILGGWSWLKNTSAYPQSSQNAMELYSINNCSVIFPFILLIVIKFFLSHTWYFALKLTVTIEETMVYFSNQVTKLLYLKASTSVASYYFIEQ